MRGPICDMVVDPATEAYLAEHDGRPYWFCSAYCLARFKADPGALLAEEGATPRPFRSRAHLRPETTRRWVKSLTI